MRWFFGRGRRGEDPIDVFETYLKQIKLPGSGAEDDQHWHFTRENRDDGAAVLKFNYSPDHGQFTCYVAAAGQGNAGQGSAGQGSAGHGTEIYQYAVAGNRVPAAKIPEACEFVARFNYRVRACGRLELDVDEGEVRFVTRAHFKGSKLSQAMVEEVFRTNLTLSEYGILGLMKIVYGDMAPDAAVATVLGDPLPETGTGAAKADSEADEDETIGGFSRMLLRVLGIMALSHGSLVREEVELIQDLYRQLFEEDVPESSLRAELDWLTEREEQIEPYLRREGADLAPRARELLVKASLKLARANGGIGGEEREIAQRIAEAIGVPAQEAKRIVAEGAKLG